MFGIAKKLWITVFVFAASVIFVSWTAGEEQQSNATSQETVTSEEGQAEQSTEWIWGEVVSVDNTYNKVTVKYMDEESLEEKELTFRVDKDTTYENAESLLDIKLKDNISVDYVVAEDGTNFAKKIAVEKAEETGLSLPETELNNTINNPEGTYP